MYLASSNKNKAHQAFVGGCWLDGAGGRWQQRLIRWHCAAYSGDRLQPSTFRHQPLLLAFFGEQAVFPNIFSTVSVFHDCTLLKIAFFGDVWKTKKLCRLSWLDAPDRVGLLTFAARLHPLFWVSQLSSRVPLALCSCPAEGRVTKVPQRSMRLMRPARHLATTH